MKGFHAYKLLTAMFVLGLNVDDKLYKHGDSGYLKWICSYFTNSALNGMPIDYFTNLGLQNTIEMTRIKITKKPPILIPGKKMRKGAILSDYMPKGWNTDLETVKSNSWRDYSENSKEK